MRRPFARDVFIALWAGVLIFLYLRTNDIGACVLRIVLLLQEISHFKMSAYLITAVVASALAMIFCAALMILGGTVLKKWLGSAPQELLWGLGLALGLGVLSSLMAILNFCHAISSNLSWCIFSAAILAAIIQICPNPRTLSKTTGRGDPDDSRSRKVIMALGAFFLWVGTLIPEITYDPLVYHLAYPSLYLLNGGHVQMPYSFYSAFPQTVEMIFLFGMSLGGELVAKGFQFAMAAAIVLLSAGAARRVSGHAKFGVVAALAFFALPMVAFNIWNCLIDIGTVLFSWCALILLAETLMTGSAAPRPQVSASLTPTGSVYLSALSGLFCGWAMGTKYTAFPLVLLLPLIAILYAKKRGKSISRPALTAFGLCAAVAVSPWIIRNAISHHNPVYPFLGTVWGVPGVDTGKWARLMIDANAHHPLEWISHPEIFLRALIEPFGWLTRRIWIGDHTGVVFLFCLGYICMPSCISPREEGTEDRHPLVFCCRLFLLGGALIWLVTGGVPRFIMPYLLPLFFVWASRCSVGVAPGRFSIANISVLLVFVISYLNVVAGFVHMESRKVLWGWMTKESFLSSQHPLYPAPPFAAYQYLNSQTPKDAGVLVVGEARTYYLARPFIAATVYDPQPLCVLAGRAATGDDLYRILAGENVRYIFVNALEAEQTQSYEPFLWNEGSSRILKDFWSSHVELAYRHVSDTEGVVAFVYKVVERSAEPAPIPAVILKSPSSS